MCPETFHSTKKTLSIFNVWQIESVRWKILQKHFVNIRSAALPKNRISSEKKQIFYKKYAK